MAFRIFVLVLLTAVLNGPGWARDKPLVTSAVSDTAISDNPAKFVQALLAKPEGELDLARGKIAIDQFVDTSTDVKATSAELDYMVLTIRRMIGTLPPELASVSVEKMRALRAFLYESGHWNNGRPFAYDLNDPMGEARGAQSLTRYLATRKGNCVSMPILFVALGERLGLDVTLSTAPLHIFVKWTEPETGITHNLEATSGGGTMRDSSYRKKLPMTDEAIARGVYMKKLTRKEALAVMASSVLDHLLATGRYEEAIDAADALIDAYPANAYAMVKKGTAYYRLFEREFIQIYPRESDIPPARLSRAWKLKRANEEAFAQAESLGWRMPLME